MARDSMQSWQAPSGPNRLWEPRENTRAREAFRASRRPRPANDAALDARSLFAVAARIEVDINPPEAFDPLEFGVASF
ncbi:hypothetical protein JGU66_19900 [Myxococcaceae bacterium JPH2]|nr:hypothetical protein [Myxococcaceae bacterium JPH2]